MAHLTYSCSQQPSFPNTPNRWCCSDTSSCHFPLRALQYSPTGLDVLFSTHEDLVEQNGKSEQAASAEIQTALWLLWHSSCTQLWSRYWARQIREIQMGWSQWKHTTPSDSFFSYPEHPAEDRGLSAGWLSDLSSPHTDDQALLISVELGGSGMPRSKPRPCTPQPPHSSHTRCQGLQQLFLPKPGYSLKMSGP